MASLVIDDHLLRDVLVGERTPDIDGLVTDQLATTGLWLFRLSASFADPSVLGKLSAPVASLPDNLQATFRSQLVSLPPEIEVLPLRQLAWPMAELQRRQLHYRPVLAGLVRLQVQHQVAGGGAG